MSRTLSNELKSLFDAQLQATPIVAFQEKSNWRAMMSLAAGIFVGTKDEPTIQLFRDTLCRPSGEDWCMAFAQSCAAYVEICLARTSLLPPSQGVLYTWNNADLSCKRQVPKLGDIVVWEHGNTIQGHCGVVTGVPGVSSDTFNTVEGNTTPGIGIAREGDGVYQKIRHVGGGSETFRLRGFISLWPDNPLSALAG